MRRRVEVGAYGGGVAYKMTKTADGYSYSIVHSFNASNDGWLIYGGLVRGRVGNLFLAHRIAPGISASGVFG